MFRVCHCEAAGRGNLQHRGVMTDTPINIEYFGFTMLIGWLQNDTAVLEIPTGFALGMTDWVVCAYYRSCCVKSISVISKMIHGQISTINFA